MSFSTLPFLLYFLPGCVLLWALAPHKLRPALLALAGAAFACWGAGAAQTLALLCVSAAVYALALALARLHGAARRALLVFSLALLLALLVLCRLPRRLLLALPLGADAALPFLGASFVLFRAASYLIDVFRGDVPPERSAVRFLAYALFFPHLTMGPITRYGAFADALGKARFSRRELEDGFALFVAGLGCKVLLADRLAPLWAACERIGFGSLSAPLAWLGAVGYSMQLYFDFAGYSLMAQGLGQMLSLPLPRNFDSPYGARSVGQFYRRWHVTLGSWFRDYVYIPLGGSRSGAARTLLALALTWALTGLWHGLSAHFLLWGLALFAFIALEKFAIGGFLERRPLLSHAYLLFVIVQTWVVFRVEKLSDLAAYFSRLYPFFGGQSVYAGDFARQLAHFWPYLLAGGLVCLPAARRFFDAHRRSALVWAPLFVVFWLCLYLIAAQGGEAFLYADF